jgi:hypothetical protein
VALATQIKHFFINATILDERDVGEGEMGVKGHLRRSPMGDRRPESRPKKEKKDDNGNGIHRPSHPIHHNKQREESINWKRQQQRHSPSTVLLFAAAGNDDGGRRRKVRMAGGVGGLLYSTDCASRHMPGLTACCIVFVVVLSFSIHSIDTLAHNQQHV